MSIFAIGDLHLPGGDKKPMDVFGAHWERHFERICADWQSRVKPEDIVLIPGDISWAMQLSDALNDLREIAKLPGTILLLRGNHDYWWSSLSQLRACLPENMHAVQNDAFDAGDCVFCGTRGWTIPLGQNATAQDEKLTTLTYGSLEIQPERYSVKLAGQSVACTPREVELLYLLASHPGRVFDREQILSRIWGYDFFGDTRTVDTHIKRLRQKLTCEEMGQKWDIITVYGVGYKFEAEA